MSSKVVSSKGFGKSANDSNGKTIKKTQTFNQKQSEANELLLQSIRFTMNDKRRLCEKMRDNNSLTNSPKSCQSHSHSKGMSCRSSNLIINHALTYGNTTEDSVSNDNDSLYKDIKLEFIENDKKNKGPRYEFNIDPLLMCLICRGLMTNPCKCYKCSTLYCRRCIENAIINTSKCPKCFNLISNNNLIPVDMSAIYLTTIIKCPFAGCKDHFNLMEIKAHLLVCAFKETKATQRVNVTKILPDPINDSYIKLHLLKYLHRINQTEIDLTESLVLSEEEQKRRNEGVGGENALLKDLKTLKGNINVFNSTMDKTVKDIQNASNKTNESIKNILKKMPNKSFQRK